MYSTPERDAARARDEAATRRIAINAGWRQEALLELRRTRSPWPIYLPDVDLLLSPLSVSSPPGKGIHFTMGLTRCDALQVGVGMSSAGPTGVFGVVGIWGRRAIKWYSDLRAWRSRDGELWFASEPNVPPRARVGFPLTGQRMRALPAPWSDDGEQMAGFARAERMLLGREAC